MDNEEEIINLLEELVDEANFKGKNWAVPAACKQWLKLQRGESPTSLTVVPGEESS